MGLPGREHVEIAGHGQHVFGHAGAEALNVPFFRPMKTELAIKTLGVDLRRHLQKQHTRETAAMGMGGVVVTLSLHI